VVRRLTVKLVESIRETERQADDLIREAQQKARQIIREAEEQAAQLLKEGIAAAEEQSGELLAKAETEARQEAAALAEAYQKEIESIKSEAGARLPEAVAMIAGKVVSIHADS
jgi:V/A-type H+-transporting ATPase subunit G/H